MKFGLHSVNLHTCGYPAAARIGRAAEAAGFESLWVADHVVLPDPPVPGRPMAPHMRLPDPVVALTFLAAHTQRIKLATGVIILPQRQAVVLAKQLASLDVLSNRRLIFGLGVGWCEPEMRSTGAPFAERGKVADDYLAAMRAMWTQTKPSYKGVYVAFDGVQAMPRPVQTPVPIVVGGRTPPRIAAPSRRATAGTASV
jgi:probable F420-dependent oxidoreductase